MKLLLLDAHEAIMQPQRDTGDHAWMAQWRLRVAPRHAEGHSMPEEWLNLYQELSDIERDLDEMVGLLKLNRGPLFDAYHALLAIKDTWMDCRARDFSRDGELTQQGEQIIQEEQELFAELMRKIKLMLTAAR